MKKDLIQSRSNPFILDMVVSLLDLHKGRCLSVQRVINIKGNAKRQKDEILFCEVLREILPQ